MSELEIQKSLKFPPGGGGGGQAYLGIFPKFFRLFYDGSPKSHKIFKFFIKNAAKAR